jgi:hypothetical protein
VVIESKEDVKKRGVSSPDRAESLMLCFADQTPLALDWIREQVEAQAGQQPYDDRPAVSQRAPLPTQAVEEDVVEGNQLIDEYPAARLNLMVHRLVRWQGVPGSGGWRFTAPKHTVVKSP